MNKTDKTVTLTPEEVDVILKSLLKTLGLPQLKHGYNILPEAQQFVYDDIKMLNRLERKLGDNPFE